jgi:hypothetical protein
MEQSPSWEANWLNLELIKKFPAFYGTRKFITVLTSARHLSLSWANPIQSPQQLPTSSRSILILSSHLRLTLMSVFHNSISLLFVILNHIVIHCHYRTFFTSSSSSSSCLSSFQLPSSLYSCHIVIFQNNCPLSLLVAFRTYVSLMIALEIRITARGKYLWKQKKNTCV